jgi:hypothetical protein
MERARLEVGRGLNGDRGEAASLGHALHLRLPRVDQKPFALIARAM